MRQLPSPNLYSLHPAELESYRQKPIVDCIAEDEEAEHDWEEQIEGANAFDVFDKMKILTHFKLMSHWCIP